MNARHLILTLSLALAAGAGFAAIKQGPLEPVKAAAASQGADTAIPRIVITASRSQAVEPAVARIVVVARRTEAAALVAAK